MIKKIINKILIISLVIIFFIVIPTNNFIFTGKELYNSFLVLVERYSLFNNIIFTFSVFYSVLIIVFILNMLIVRVNALQNPTGWKLFNFLNKNNSLPFLLILFLFVQWFPNNIYAGFYFLLVIIFFDSLSRAKDYLKQFYSLYGESILMLNTSDSIKRKLFTDGVQKKFIMILLKHQGFYFSMLLIFEYIQQSRVGIGRIIRFAIEYWNTNYLFTAFILIFLIIILFEKAITAVVNRFFPWDEKL